MNVRRDPLAETGNHAGHLAHLALASAAGALAEGGIEQETEGKKVLAELDGMAPDDPQLPKWPIAIPLGDSESLERLRQRSDDVTTRQAGSTALVDATVRPAGESRPGQGHGPGGESSAGR
jgi:hypothetical protein